MAAKRFGSVPTNLEGSANQILRVKSDESGFEYFTPGVLPTYTPTNVFVANVVNETDWTAYIRLIYAK